MWLKTKGVCQLICIMATCTSFQHIINDTVILLIFFAMQISVVYPPLELFSHFVFIFMNTSRTVVCNARNLVAMQFSTQQTDHKRWISVVYPLLELFLFFVFIFMNSQKLYNVWYRRVIFRSFIFENNWFKLF